MITINTKENEGAELKISKGTPHKTILLGIEMLIESLLDDIDLDLTIDDLLFDLKTIYERDNK